jgi:hypothetical protein
MLLLRLRLPRDLVVRLRPLRLVLLTMLAFLALELVLELLLLLC